MKGQTDTKSMERRMGDKYHHGNLRQALIDTGIKIINEYGEEALSLRKVAAACGVSHAAPYAHFKDKESLLSAIKECVTERFTKELEAAVESTEEKTAEAAILALGKRYIVFFRKNPDYFNFLFHKQQIRIHTDMSKENPEDYAPFLLQRRLFKKYIEENKIRMDDKTQEYELLKSWAVVQGFASIACMEGVSTTVEWEDIVERCLK